MGREDPLSLLDSQVEMKGQIFQAPFYRQAIWVAGMGNYNYNKNDKERTLYIWSSYVPGTVLRAFP